MHDDDVDQVGPSHRYAWHAVGFAAAVVLGLWVDAGVSPLAALRSLAFAVIGVGLVQLVVWIAIRDIRRAAVVAVLVLVAFISKSFALTMLGLLERMDPWEALVWLALLAALLAVVARIVLRRRRHWTLAGATYTLNVLSLALLAVVIASGVASDRVSLAVEDLDQGRSLDEAIAEGLRERSGADELPNIYVLILDGYPRADILEEIFDYDNTDFLDGMAALGFDIADASHSEYLWTEHTLLSLLHRDYLERIEPLQAAMSSAVTPQPTTRQLINDNPMFADLRTAGYEIVSVPTPVEGTAIRRADVLVDHGRLNEFEFKLLTSTFVGDIVNVVAPSFGADQHRARIIDSLAALRQVAGDESAAPRFTLAHLLTPHWPAVWTAEGGELNPVLSPEFLNNLLTQQTVDRDTFIQQFRGHLEHTNRLVMEAVRDVIEADRDAVIVVMSDHGSWVGFEGPGGEPRFDLRERTGILFAARTPGQPQLFPDDISPVNVFRHLSDGYLGAELGTVDPLPGGRHTIVGD